MAANTEKKPYHHGDLRSALIDEAVKMIQRDGTDKFSLRACARHVGVDAAAAYRHFPSKKDVLGEVRSHGWRRLALSMEHEMAGASGAEARLRAAGRGYVLFATKQSALYDAVFHISGAQPAGAASSAGDSGLNAYELLSHCLDEMVDELKLSGTEREGAEIVAWSAVHGLASLLNQDLLRPSPTHIDHLVDKVCRVVVSGLRQPNPENQ